MAIPSALAIIPGSAWDPSCIKNGDVATLACLPSLITNIISAIFMFIGVVLLFLIIITGIKYIASSGNSKTLQTLQKEVTNLVIGFVIIICAFLIVKLVADITGVDVMKIVFP